MQLSSRLVFDPRGCHTTDSVTSSRSVLSLCIQEQHPSVLEHFEDFAKLLQGKRLAVFLDYDGKHWPVHAHSLAHTTSLVPSHTMSMFVFAGTLTPIVKDPDGAFMSSQVSCLRASVFRQYSLQMDTLSHPSSLEA